MCRYVYDFCSVFNASHLYFTGEGKREGRREGTEDSASYIYVTTRSVVDYASANELQSTIDRVVTYLFHDQ